MSLSGEINRPHAYRAILGGGELGLELKWLTYGGKEALLILRLGDALVLMREMAAAIGAEVILK